MKSIENIFSFIFGCVTIAIAIAVLLKIFGEGVEQSPIHIGLWIAALVAALFYWYKSPKNTKAKEFSLAALNCPIAAFFGGPILLYLNPSADKFVIPLHIALMGLMLVFLVTAAWLYQHNNKVAY